MAIPTTLARAGGASPARRPRRPASWQAAVSWLVPVLFLFPTVGSSLGRGLDASWGFAINALPFTGRLPWRDVAFPYGPLGWLLFPADLGHHILAALLFWIGVHALLAVALGRVVLRQAGGGHGEAGLGGLAFAFLLVASHMLGLGADSRLVLVLGLLLAPELPGLATPSPAPPRRTLWAPALAAALAVVCGLIKLSLGLSALALLGSFVLVTWVRRRSEPPGTGRLLFAMAAAAGAVLAVAIPLLFGNPGNAWRWLALQAETVRGHAAGMGWPAAPGELAAGLLALAVVGGLLLYAGARRTGLAGLWAIFLLPVWLAFQHAFIRGDAVHTVRFFPFVLGVVALGLLFTRQPAERRAIRGAALLLLLLATGSALRFGVPAVVSRLDVLAGFQGSRHLAAAMRPAALHRRIARDQERALAPSRLPEGFAAAVRASDLGVDALPWELSYLPANRLRWVPSPTLQLYATLTRRLDALAARHFAAPRAPDLLLVEGGTVDGRSLLWDTPETARALLAAYELDPRRPTPDLLVLRRAPHPFAWHLEPRGETVAAPGRWVEVPPAPPGSWTFAALDLSPSWRGKLERWLLGLPPSSSRPSTTAASSAPPASSPTPPPAACSSPRPSPAWTSWPPCGAPALRSASPASSASASPARGCATSPPSAFAGAPVSGSQSDRFRRRGGRRGAAVRRGVAHRHRRGARRREGDGEAERRRAGVPLVGRHVVDRERGQRRRTARRGDAARELRGVARRVRRRGGDHRLAGRDRQHGGAEGAAAAVEGLAQHGKRLRGLPAQGEGGAIEPHRRRGLAAAHPGATEGRTLSPEVSGIDATPFSAFSPGPFSPRAPSWLAPFSPLVSLTLVSLPPPFSWLPSFLRAPS